ncbi:hypothetical protein AgCh_004249 [Apium graveolens]
MNYLKSEEYAESSPQGAFRIMQQDLQGHMLSAEDKIDRLQRQIELLVVGMNKNNSKKVDVDNEYVEEDDYKENVLPGSNSKGMYRDHLRGAVERQKLWQKQNKVDDLRIFGGYKEKEGPKDTQSLRHLKLIFPVYKEGTDALEWLRDCEEYFSINEVNDGKRAAIAAMHLTGVPRSRYKSLMMGQEGAIWQQFVDAFTARFGEIDTELVSDKFKRLQQSSLVEEYFDEFEKIKGRVL